ncbi:WRKY transcription factor [Actinidia chinensis var. chinensis]|uniref:WRKY transcription factor n=1 Tax=Actinidia chinensis var. chinensis TaxID=1590841 RepID=A0A2R6QKH8_ACTCC|nr:WRKY transcription factor [Actinidia chinensis var. chinensis]
MEVNKVERIVIAKPVPSRPTCSNFRSFSELLASAINSSPPNNECSETAVTAIRPKTLRLKPTANLAPVGVVSQAETSGTAICCPSDKGDKVSNSDSKFTVVYKPLAKVVKTTFSLSPNLRNSNSSVLAPVEARIRPPNQFNYHLRPNLSSNLHQNVSAQTEREKTNEPSKMAENIEDDKKTMPLTSNGDRPSYDGYNWRKYGQKQVKGSEYPRSYYKCTHPNCPVKKKVERSLDGQIAEIIYNGEHNHSKPQPQPPKRNMPVGQGQGFVSGGTGQETNNLSGSTQMNDRNEGLEGRVENQNEVGGLDRSTYLGKAPLSYDPIAAENSCALSGECEEGSKGLEVEDDEPKNKRRKNETEPGISGQEPPVVVQNSTDSEIMGDGFRWRKYGQKVVKGNPYPRSYYRCTNLNCSVRKQVERALDNPTAFITTYEGKHNHDVPTKSTNPAACEPDLQAATSKDKP